MKRVRFYLGAIVFVFAFFSAVAFKASPLVENPSYVNSSGQCVEVDVECGGSRNTCVLDLGPGIGSQTIKQFQSATSCSAALKLGN